MVVNDNAGSLAASGVLRFFASKLAPTVGAALYAGNKKPDINIGPGWPGRPENGVG